MSGGGKGHKLEDETRVGTDYLSFLVFLEAEAGQIKVSRVLNWGRRHDAKQIQTVPVYPGLPPHRGIGVLVLGYWGIGVLVLGSAWAHETFSPLRQFAWQSGYGASTACLSCCRND